MSELSRKELEKLANVPLDRMMDLEDAQGTEHLLRMYGFNDKQVDMILGVE